MRSYWSDATKREGLLYQDLKVCVKQASLLTTRGQFEDFAWSCSRHSVPPTCCHQKSQARNIRERMGCIQTNCRLFPFLKAARNIEVFRHSLGRISSTLLGFRPVWNLPVKSELSTSTCCAERPTERPWWLTRVINSAIGPLGLWLEALPCAVKNHYIVEATMETWCGKLGFLMSNLLSETMVCSIASERMLWSRAKRLKKL